MFFNNFINNIIKSMMAVCVVANGWSSVDALTENLPGGGADVAQKRVNVPSADSISKRRKNGSPILVNTPPPCNNGDQYQHDNEGSKNPLGEGEASIKGGYGMEQKNTSRGDQPSVLTKINTIKQIDKNDLSPDDPLTQLIQSGELEELRNMMINTTNLSEPTKILMIEGRLDSVCELFGSSSYAKYVLDELLSILDEITKKNKEVLCYASGRYINIFPTLLRCERLNDNLAKFENLISAINLTHGKLMSPDNATDNSGTVATKLQDIVNALNEY